MGKLIIEFYCGECNVLVGENLIMLNHDDIFSVDGGILGSHVCEGGE